MRTVMFIGFFWIAGAINPEFIEAEFLEAIRVYSWIFAGCIALDILKKI